MRAARAGQGAARGRAAVAGLLALAVALSPACFGQTSDPVPDWPGDDPPDLDQALLRPETVQASYAQDEAPQPGMAQMGLVGDDAVLLPPLRDGLVAANTMTIPALALINAIGRDRARPPIFADANRAIWEVERAGALHIFRLERTVAPGGGDQWNYNLLVRPLGGADTRIRPLMSGFYRPGPLVDGRQTGTGLLRYEYDTFAVLPAYQVEARGVGSLAFRSDGRGLTLNLLFQGFRPRGADEPLAARYTYRLEPDRSGRFEFVLRRNILGDPEAEPQRIGASVVWRSDRAGRGAAVLDDPRLQVDVFLDECWDLRGLQRWVQWTPEVQPSDGQPSDCIGDLGDLTLEPPDLGIPEPGEEPEIP